MGCNYLCPTPIEQEIESVPDSGYAPFYFSEDGDTLLFGFTSRSFTRVLSALINGAAVTYGAEGYQVVWDFLVNVEYPLVMPTFCEQMIDCIENDDDTQHSIEHMLEHNDEFQDFLSEWIMEHPGGTKTKKGEPVDPTIPITVTQGGECDLDLLYGQCLALVQTANRMVVDFLERWETYTNKGEVISDMVNSVPLLSELAQASGVSGVLEYANDLVDSVSENYNSDYDLAYEIGLACELFCAAQDADCKVTVGMFAGIMNARASNALNLTNIVELIVSLTDQDITGINVADLYLAFFADSIAVANLVIPVTWGLDTLLSVMYAQNEPNNDWTTECDECPTPLADCVDFTSGQGTWRATGNDVNKAQFSSSGIAQANNTFLQITGDDYADIHSVTITFNTAWSGVDDFHKFYVLVSNIDASNQQSSITEFGGLSMGDTITVTTSGDNWTTLAIAVAAGGNTYPPNGSNATAMYIIEICVSHT